MTADQGTRATEKRDKRHIPEPPGDPRSRAGRRRGRTAAVAIPVGAAGVAAGVLAGTLVLRPAHQASTPQPTISTAPVVRTNLVNTVQVNGELDYAGSYAIANQQAGTAYTWLPAVGAVINRGHTVYEVDGTPVTLFYGERPEWRSLSEGVTPGPDVAQLDRNLIALGYGAYLTVSDYYTGETAYAVELWQEARGLPVTGTVPLGQVAFASGPLRVTSLTPTLGGTPQPGAPVLTATSPDPVVMALLPVTQEYLVHVGNQVTVTLPDGVTTTPGTVTAVSSVATSGGSGPQGAGQSSSGPPGGNSGSSPDSVTLTLSLTHPQAAGNLDQAPVTVNIVSARATGVLAVPVSALVALAGGGYAVDVIGAHDASHLVPVSTGLFSNTLVQVSGPGLAVGQEVEVPSS
jgi:Putative peptidoglycan binding domain